MVAAKKLGQSLQNSVLTGYVIKPVFFSIAPRLSDGHLDQV
jgi:hypothetical protein